ncbi:MAG: ATP-binding cassette domain-containing protein [Alphaproteobacteria bacterium]
MSAALVETLRAARSGNYQGISQYTAALMPLLAALGWRGSPRDLAEALPHFSDDLDLVGLRNTLANLNYRSEARKGNLRDLDPRLTPCLFIPDQGSIKLVRQVTTDSVKIFDTGLFEEKTVSRSNVQGTIYFFSPTQLEEENSISMKMGWVRQLASRFKPFFLRIFVMTVTISILNLATPLFVMAVYDKVIAAGSEITLIYLGLGIVLALLGEVVLQYMRHKLLAYIAARVDLLAGSAVFQKLLNLPMALTERASVGAQTARFREFESLRDFFVGPLALAFLELPFVILFIVAVALIGGMMALVPAVMLVIYLIVGALIIPAVQRGVLQSMGGTSGRHSFLVETVSNLRAIKYHAAENIWLDRFRDLSAQAATANYRTARIANFASTFSQSMMVGAGILTLVVGIELVLHQNLSVGGLIACMALVWRILTPMQMLLIALTRLEQVHTAIRRVDQLMGMRAERNPYIATAASKRFEGRVSFNRVSIRYIPEGDPALIGASFDIPPGELVAITGANGAGKSTILKLIAGLYQPQAGSISIDGIDIRQIDPHHLRHSIGYVPQVCELFHGTIEQNLQLGNPTADHMAIREAAHMAGILSIVETLPEGFQTRIGDQILRQLPTGFQQSLALARAYLSKAPIMLFDEPGSHLDADGDRVFMATLTQLRGRATVFLVTHRPSHMRLADRMLVLDRGIIRFAGTPEEVLTKLPKDLM